MLTEYFGRDSVHQEVNAVTEDAIAKISAPGATMIRITIPELDLLTRNIQVAEYETKIAFNKYLASLGPRAPVKTLDEFITGGGFHGSLKAGLETDARMIDGLNQPEYKNRLLRRDSLRQAVMNTIAVRRVLRPALISAMFRRRVCLRLCSGQVRPAATL